MEQNFIISLAVAVPVALAFGIMQWLFHHGTMRNLLLFRNFFDKTNNYETIDVNNDGNTKKQLKNVADDGTELHILIGDINEYLASCKGTATFNIIQNKTERRLTKLYDKAASKASFPTHLGLMGTFLGVFLGLGAFLISSANNPEGITDGAIHSLILGVLVSMLTSFVGLVLSTRANNSISNAKNKSDDDKNEFYEYIQNKLMPSVDVSLTEALGKLHETVSNFEPSFSTVIAGFRQTFKECTDAFGEDFRKSVKRMVGAVETMSNNINQITENVDLLEDLLTRVSGAEWKRYMRQFAEATDHLNTLTQSLNDFERARRMMLAAVQEAINLQKTYNESLTIPRDVATSINTILQRVVKFEECINELGVNIAQTHMLGNTEVLLIREQIKAIKDKQRVTKEYIEMADKKLDNFFEEQLKEISRLEYNYEESLKKVFEQYEELVTQHKEEIGRRHETFKEAIDEKFELSEVRTELGQLKKIPSMASTIDEVKRGQDKLQRTNEGIRSELNAFNAAKEDEKKSALKKIMDSGSNSAKDREIEQQKKENEALQKQLDQAIKEKEEERKVKERLEAMERTEYRPQSISHPKVEENQPKKVDEQRTIVEEPQNDSKKRRGFFEGVKSLFGVK